MKEYLYLGDQGYRQTDRHTECSASQPRLSRLTLKKRKRNGMERLVDGTQVSNTDE